MRTLILYCSYTGHTHALAVKKATELDCDLEEVKDVRKLSWVAGIRKAPKREKTDIYPIRSDLSRYDKIIIMSPVWASHPVPAINNVLECLPEGKKVEFFMVSAGGGTKKSAEETKELVAQRGCEVVGYTDVVVKVKDGDVLVRNVR